MIVLTDVATKLSQILNGVNNPIDFQFAVKSQGYAYDSSIDLKTGKNTIPVFVSQKGGQFNAIPDLKQVSYQYEVIIYFPVRFKESFYHINSFLEDTFVGKQMIYGTQNALSNIGVATYEELINFDIEAFSEWVEETYGQDLKLYREQEEITETYMTMKFYLYLTTLNDGYIYGNDIKYRLTARFQEYTITSIDGYERYVAGDETGYTAWKNEDDEIIYTKVSPTLSWEYENRTVILYEKEDGEFVESEDGIISVEKVARQQTHLIGEYLVFANSGTGGSITPASQQIVGVDNFIKNKTNTTSFNKTFSVFPKLENSVFWERLLTCYNMQHMNEIVEMELVKEYSNGMSFSYNQITLAFNDNAALGEPYSISITLGD